MWFIHFGLIVITMQRWISIITDRIRRMREGNVFSLSTPGGGVPSSSLGQGGTTARSRWGVPQPGPDGGTVGYPLPGMGYPLPGPDRGTQGTPPPGMGYPPCQVQTGGYPPGQVQMGVPPPTRDGVPPPVMTTEGVLATWRSVCSCVHAVGLSCLSEKFHLFKNK